MVNSSVVVTIPSDVLFQELSGESVLLNLSSGKYYGLDEVGTRIWMVLGEHPRISDALFILEKEYEVDQERLSSDMSILIDDLIKHGLLQIEPSDYA